MQKKLHIKKGDTVMVISGESRGQKGRVLEVNREKNRAIVEGVNMVSKHTKPNAKAPQGGILKKEAAIHVSNLMLVDPTSGKPTRVGRKLNESNKLVRPELEVKYKDEIIPALMKEFSYSTVMQVPRLKKIVLNQGVGQAIADKKILEFGLKEMTDIAGQKAVQTYSSKDISNFKLRKDMPIGIMVTLREERMYEFLQRPISVALPRIRDFKGISAKLDGRGNYTLGITEQIIFPEIDLDKIAKIMGLQITFVTSAGSDEEALALLKHFGLPFKTSKN